MGRISSLEMLKDANIEQEGVTHAMHYSDRKKEKKNKMAGTKGVCPNALSSGRRMKSVLL